MTLVDHDTFFKKLSDLFESKKDQGSIWLTHKRLTYDGEDSTMKDVDDSSEYPCLLRATDGKSVSFSTKVEPAELLKFHAFYGSLLKTSMTTLRKRDKKREKLRTEEAAKRRQNMTASIKLEGNKRGKGRRQRQRKIKALMKQQASQAKHEEREEERKKVELYR